MGMTDPVADLLTRIRNGAKAHKNAVDVPKSKLKKEIVQIMLENKYLKDMIELPDNKQGILRIYLRYSVGDEPVIKGLQRVSRPGLRTYLNAEKLKKTALTQRGLMVVSTSQGVMTNYEAVKKGVGGEVLLRCW
jgi:small subunit ribosomal protein S8